jgi:hypothetical protein
MRAVLVLVMIGLGIAVSVSVEEAGKALIFCLLLAGIGFMLVSKPG